MNYFLCGGGEQAQVIGATPNASGANGFYVNSSGVMVATGANPITQLSKIGLTVSATFNFTAKQSGKFMIIKAPISFANLTVTTVTKNAGEIVYSTGVREHTIIVAL